MNTIRKWFYTLTGGRPMINIGFAFTDVVTREPVYYYLDQFGRKWMAHNKWGEFRVSATEPTPNKET